MAMLDFNAFLDPISEEDPCGPDLDLIGDMDFMNFTARIEGLLPASFFSFNRTSIDYPAEFEAIRKLSEQSRDLRLLVIYAKLAILNRDVTTFAGTLDLIATLLETKWSAIHPRDEGGDFVLRVAVVQALDDNPQVLLPIQHLVLAENRRYGQASYRAALITDGKLNPREGETKLDSATLERIFQETETAVLVGKRDQFLGMVRACERIQAASIDQGGYENQISLEKLVALVGAIATMIDGHIAQKDPSASLNPPAEESAPEGDGTDAEDGSGTTMTMVAVAGSSGIAAVADRAGAIRALKAVKSYFERHEPASPAYLLVAQADQLMGKTLYETMRTLLPDHVAKAVVPVGQASFRLPVSRLAESLDSSSSYSSYSSDSGSEDDSETKIEINTRKDAMKMIDHINAFIKSSEPASPLPVLLTRAKELSDRDFLSLLKDIFDPNTLEVLRHEGSGGTNW